MGCAMTPERFAHKVARRWQRVTPTQPLPHGWREASELARLLFPVEARKQGFPDAVATALAVAAAPELRAIGRGVVGVLAREIFGARRELRALRGWR